METIDHMQGYPLIPSNPKYSDFPTLSQYDAYIGNIQSDLPCNGSCACQAASCPYTVPLTPGRPPPLTTIATPPSREQIRDIPPPVGIPGDIPPPPPPPPAPAHTVVYHSYPPQSHPVIIQTVPRVTSRVSDTPRIPTKFPEASYPQPQPQPIPREYYPNYAIPHYASSPVYVHSKYYTSHIVPSTNSSNSYPRYHSATAPPPTVRTGAVSAATGVVPIATNTRTVSRDINVTVQKAPKARYYGYNPPTTATKTMNNRRQPAGERREMRQRISMEASANAAPNEIVCSFHMDFIPKLDDLRKYLSAFGEVVRKIEIEWDCTYGGGPNIDGPIKGVPMAKIQFKTEGSARRVCDQSCTHVIPSGIKFRAYRSMQHYVNSYKKRNSKKKRKK